jgi:hypothetical protein
MGTGKTTIGAAATYTDFGRVRGLRLTNRLG